MIKRHLSGTHFLYVCHRKRLTVCFQI